MTEQEQIQQIKNWAKQYGPTIIAGILLALVITSGWRYWQNYRNKILTHASSVYDEMLTLRAQGNTAGTIVQAKKLLRNYNNTPYAQHAALMLARDAILKKELPRSPHPTPVGSQPQQRRLHARNLTPTHRTPLHH